MCSLKSRLPSVSGWDNIKAISHVTDDACVASQLITIPVHVTGESDLKRFHLYIVIRLVAAESIITLIINTQTSHT